MSEADVEILSVSELYESLVGHIESAFGRRHPRWVRGEVQKVYEKSHLYLDLVDTDAATDRRAMLGAHCWYSAWGPIKRELADQGVVLAPGMVLNVLGFVDVYEPRSQLGFTIQRIDVEGALGEVARRRRALVEQLRSEGLLETNKRREVAAVPLRIGLVASPGTEGFADFTGQLVRSGFAFDVSLVPVTVQGEGAPAQIAAAIARLDGADRDVLCVVRGGGSKGDLAAFDDERVARAIATAATPVFTGIGHTGDESVADLVAHTRAITPTQLGEQLVDRVATWRDAHVRVPAQRLLESSRALVDEGEVYLAERRRSMTFAVRDRLRAEQRHLATARDRLLVQARHVTAAAKRSLVASRQLLKAYDPRRRLAEGWALVTDAAGRVVGSIEGVSVGDALSVRVGDGTLGAVVTTKEADRE